MLAAPGGRPARTAPAVAGPRERAGHGAMMATPRIDMAGAKPQPYYHEFGRVFAGFAGP